VPGSSPDSFNEYIGDVTAATWPPKKGAFADLTHIAPSAQYHAPLSMTKVRIPTIIQKASAQGAILSVREKIRGGEPVFEVMVIQDKGNPTDILRPRLRRADSRLRKNSWNPMDRRDSQ